jgi:hypothetical protein
MELKINEKNDDNIIIEDNIKPKIKKCENMKEYQHNYYNNKHKNELLTKIKCEICGVDSYLSNYPRHKKSKKHINKILMENCNKECDNKNLV